MSLDPCVLYVNHLQDPHELHRILPVQGRLCVYRLTHPLGRRATIWVPTLEDAVEFLENSHNRPSSDGDLKQVLIDCLDQDEEEGIAHWIARIRSICPKIEICTTLQHAGWRMDNKGCNAIRAA